MAILAPHSDRAVQEYRHRSGARDTYWLNELVKYVRSQGLYNNFRLYPFMPRTNADSGSTAFGLGGLTANEMTLINGPTWGASGLAFASASSQYGTVLGHGVTHDPADGMMLIARIAKTTESNSDTFSATNPEYFLQWSDGIRGANSGDPYYLVRSSDGANIQTDSDGGGNASTNDQCLVAQYVNSGSMNLWIDKSTISLSTLGGSQPTLFNTNVDVTFGCVTPSSPTGFLNATAHALCFLTGTVTTEQRETITDLINEL